MIRQGDIHFADFHDELRRRVMVLSIDRFHRDSEQVIVAPEIFTTPEDDSLPWRIPAVDSVFAVDRVRSLHVDRLLDRVDRAPLRAVTAARRALRAIT